jgi:lipopolysaccharide transport system ATP-binding protein
VSVIEVDSVWKDFRIPHERRTTIVEHLAGILSILEGSRYSYEEFWALKNVSFHLEHGESLGVVGPNGSGKSTLLKIMARVMKPRKGSVKITGLLAPVLELGIGFHGDLTVKENAVVYGVIMGLRRSEMRKRIGGILDFAGLAKFQDAKLKHLSSGMQVRLAFAIAIQTEADIFLVDEALAVGDIEFKEKCLEKFREFKNQEKSIVLVSHDLELVSNFCEKSLYLLNGETRFFGSSEESIKRYLEDMRTSRTQ